MKINEEPEAMQKEAKAVRRKVNLINDAGVMRIAPIGFSWTMLFFGPYVPLFRGDLKWTILHLLTFLLTLPLLGVGWLILPFIYNIEYTADLLERGYKPADEESRVALVNKGIIADMNLKE